MSTVINRQVSDNCIELIKKFEGYYQHAYKDVVGVNTIGWGSVSYPDGRKVQIGDTCTVIQAEQYLQFEVAEKAKAVATMLHDKPFTQHQFDALVSFAYNLGIGALQHSTLLKKALVNPNDYTIAHYKTLAGYPVPESCEFLRWVRAGYKIYRGLVLRRAAEANLYSKI